MGCMANRSKATGTEAESAVRDYLRANGYPYADRLTLHGSADIGDIRLGDGIPVTVEVKGGQKAVSALGSHVDELDVEMANAKAETGVVIAKRSRKGNVGDWFAVMPVDLWLDLMHRLYGHE